MSVPQEFRTALETFAESLKANFKNILPANPEEQLKDPTRALLAAVCPKVESKAEVPVRELGGRPDIGVTVDGLLCGFVELKAPSKSAEPEELTGEDKRQWEKFKAVFNLIYTNGSVWVLYRSGKREGEAIRFSGDVTAKGKKAFTQEQASSLYRLLENFLSWNPTAPTKPKQLAEMLAPLCGYLRDDVRAAVAKPDSNLSLLAGQWRSLLFPDATDERFADAYAQTLTYALLLARIEDPTAKPKLTAESAAKKLQSGHGLLAKALQVLSQEEAREEIAPAVGMLERLVSEVEPAKLVAQAVKEKQDDPWLYFYEHFLAAYDKKLRNDYGVYYTPIPVIGVQVRLVSQLLKEKFGKEFSYADKEVVLLDPAGGTDAYPLAALKHVLNLDAVVKRGKGFVSAMATACAEKFHSFEILVGPYAVAHLRFTQAIREAGGLPPEDGIRVYLTDTLESPNAQPKQLALEWKKLTEEHKRAQEVKSTKRVVVCMSNPPYNREQRDPATESKDERKGGWVRHGDKNVQDNRPILQDFIEPATAAGAGVHVKNLYNDYVYFWRWALWKLFENPVLNSTGPGIVSFITASSYLRGPGFVGMRQKMREAFDELWIIDLEGDNIGARKTENVFNIQTPVAIAIGVRYGDAQPNTPAKVHYTRVIGTRDEKYAKLDKVLNFDDLKWEDCFDGWQQPLLPKQEGDYTNWPMLTELFPWQHSGAQFKRKWPIGETAEVLQKRWKALLASDRRTAFHETRDRKVDLQYSDLLEPNRRLPSISQLPAETPMPPVVRYAYRSFDRKWAIQDARICDDARPALWQSQSERQVYMTSLLTKVLGLGPAATATSLIPDIDYFCGRGGKDMIPLWRDAAATQPNLPAGLLAALGQALGRVVTAEDFFAYAYAVLASPSYVEKFSEELTVPPARLPVTKDKKLFSEAIALGRRLVWLHTFGERFAPEGEVFPTGKAQCLENIPATAYPEKFSHDSVAQLLRVGDGEFNPVSDAVWNFSVSGLAVLQSWLSYRMKSGAGRSSSPLDEIRPEKWTDSMTDELLKLLWILEHTVALFPKLASQLDAILAGPLFRADELPKPTDEERQPPKEEAETPDKQETMHAVLSHNEVPPQEKTPKKSKQGNKPKRKD